LRALQAGREDTGYRALPSTPDAAVGVQKPVCTSPNDISEETIDAHA
jgi:hypothetical protein